MAQNTHGSDASGSIMEKNLSEYDPELFELVKKENERQLNSVELIASENFTSLSVRQCLGSCLTNKYSEGLPGQRYYGGNEFIDRIEILAQKRSLETFNLDPSKWGVNVQPYSGSPANFAVYAAVVEPHGRIMGLDLPDGGHLTHGFMTSTKKISATSIFFESMPYKVDPVSGLIDYNKLAENARLFKPKLIIAGVSCYARCLDYKRFREIADENNAILFADMSHVAGLVAAKVIPSPFEYCDIVTTTTHKTLRGPRAGVIFFRKGEKPGSKNGQKYDFENRINMTVFPGLQGGPHNHQIAGIAVSMKQATTKQFSDYQHQVVKNAQMMATAFQSNGFKVATGGTDIHLLLVDLKPFGLNGAKAEFVLELVNIACNKNTAPGDKSALNPSGIRLGTPAITSRGFKEEQISIISDIMFNALILAKKIDAKSGPTLADYKKTALSSEFEAEFANLKKEVIKTLSQFPIPGHTDY